jgi:SAM-dependent methyltransferase
MSIHDRRIHAGLDGALYDDLSADYDRFVNWPARLASELPFIERELRQIDARRVLDAACGTGMHALSLAERGYAVSGADLSEGMIAKARTNARERAADASFEVAGFGELFGRLGSGFDAVVCLGNSLPHVLNVAELEAALSDMAACLRSDGLLLIQNRNFDRVLDRCERWMDPQAHRESGQEWLFLRFYDFHPKDRLTFNLITLHRAAGRWQQHAAAAELWAVRRDQLVATLGQTGFDRIACFGNMGGEVFSPECSPNLVIVARKTG